MDLLKLGAQSRKTGWKPRANLTKDRHNMEDLDEFFEDSTFNEAKGAKTPKSKSKVAAFAGDDFFDLLIKQAPRKTLGVRRARPDSSRSDDAPKQDKIVSEPPITTIPTSSSETLENGTDLQDYPTFADMNDMDMDEQPPLDDNMESNMTLSPIPLESLRKSPSKAAPNPSPVSQQSSPSKKIRPNKALSSLTKNMALARSQRKPTKADDMGSDSSDESENDSILPSSGDDDTFDADYLESQRRSQDAFELTELRESVIRPSPFPSPPPEGGEHLRRSRRTKIAPLAYWRNERIVYSRTSDSNGGDPDSTLIRDIRKIPLQEIKEVVHIPEAQKTKVTKRGRKPKAVGKTKKTKTKSDAYDYESDPELVGSEWYKNKSLETDVYVSGESTELRVVAWAPDGGAFTPPEPSGEKENFTIAPLFDADSNVFAAGLLDFPVDGHKTSRSTADSLFMFHVAKGLIEVTLNTDRFVVTRGCSFEILRYNVYSLKNIGNDSARLFFVQCKLDSDAI